ncbi:hypothetical protein RND71_014835 [Anisodus tanguticus]|uniref:PDZ domain-containing protein n=1 Tax=Anisodus tanguticus TaxID=243964 RepID=A0AAE1VP23_9SOLA|nr:hypothetical protein RND71_014835 [Anisodus tanguticus]
MHKFENTSKLTGVFVSRINPLSDASRVLKKDDIILSFDGVPIANDGTVPFRNRERITFDQLVSMKKPNETAELSLEEWRSAHLQDHNSSCIALACRKVVRTAGVYWECHTLCVVRSISVQDWAEVNFCFVTLGDLWYIEVGW